jgi:hypothetical protein
MDSSVEVDGKESTMEKKAIAYTANIVVGNTGIVIEPALERKRIEEYAKENHITIVAWFEEEACGGNPLERPKLKEALACNEPHELVLMERVSAISRKWKEIRTVLAMLAANNVRVECATKLWDCISMMARYYNRPVASRAACSVRTLVMAPSGNKVKVRRPAVLAFGALT